MKMTSTKRFTPNKEILARCAGVAELHTHLMGMGSHEFWLNDILLDESKLCDLAASDNTRKETSDNIELTQRRMCCPLVWDKSNESFFPVDTVIQYLERFATTPEFWDDSDLLHAFFDEDKRRAERFAEELEFWQLKWSSNFTMDVVFPVAKLAEGLGINSNEHDDLVQTEVEERLGSVCDIKRYIVFNARKQSFEIVLGMTSKSLRKLIGGNSPTPTEAQLNAKAHITNAFSMRNPDGTEPRSIDYHSFRGAFTPQFYPRRFALKDPICHQRLDLLALLLFHALIRYDTCRPPVKYCEFSVSNSDLARPWIFDIFCSFKGVSSSFRERLKEYWFLPDAANDFPKCKYTFLAGFDRRKTSLLDSHYKDNAYGLLYEMPQLAINSMIKEIHISKSKGKTEMFGQFVDDVTALFLAHGVSYNGAFTIEDTIKLERFKQVVVGFDLFGDELGYPYIPFVAHVFIDAVRFIRNSANAKFGVRIHCAENVPVIESNHPAFRLFIAHMYTVFRGLHYLADTQVGILPRIGHGIGFPAITMASTCSDRKSGVLLDEMKALLPALLNQLTFELNPTSNFYLVKASGRQIYNSVGSDSPLDILSQHGIKFVLSTDDDGVWPIDRCNDNHPGHHSVAAEYCKAITGPGRLLKDGTLNDVVETSFNSAFVLFDSNINPVFSNVADEDATQVQHSVVTKSNYHRAHVIASPAVVQWIIKAFKSIDKSSRTACLASIYYIDLFDACDASESLKEVDLTVPSIILIATFYVSRPDKDSEKGFQNEVRLLFKKTSTSTLMADDLLKKAYSYCALVSSGIAAKSVNEAATLLFRYDKACHVIASDQGQTDNATGLISNALLNAIGREVRTARTLVTNAEIVTSFIFCSPRQRARSAAEDLRALKGIILPPKKLTAFLFSNAGKGKFVPKEKSGEQEVYVNTPFGLRGINLLFNLEDESIASPAYFYYACDHASAATAALHALLFALDKGDTKLEFVQIPDTIDLGSIAVFYSPSRIERPSALSEEDFWKRIVPPVNTALKDKLKLGLFEGTLLRPIVHSNESALYDSVIRAQESGIGIEALAELDLLAKNEVARTNLVDSISGSFINFQILPQRFVIIEAKPISRNNSSDEAPITVPAVEVSKTQSLFCISVDTMFASSMNEWDGENVKRIFDSYKVASLWSDIIFKISTAVVEASSSKDLRRGWAKLIYYSFTQARRTHWEYRYVNRWSTFIKKALAANQKEKILMKYLIELVDDKAEELLSVINDDYYFRLGNRYQKDRLQNDPEYLGIVNRLENLVNKHVKSKNKGKT